jgi:hypothetical protein
MKKRFLSILALYSTNIINQKLSGSVTKTQKELGLGWGEGRIK